MGAYGGTFVQTPNMDNLASNGVRFTQHYSNGPVCSPSRASIHTGQYAQAFGLRRVIPIVMLTSGATAFVLGFLPGLPYIAVVVLVLVYSVAVQGDDHFAFQAINTQVRVQPLQVDGLPVGVYRHVVSEEAGVDRL